MIKTIGALWLILSVCETLPAAESKKSGDTAEFKDLIRQYYEAWSSGSPENPARLYAKDSNLVFYDVAPLKYNGWDEYKQGVQKYLFDNMVSATLTPKDDLVVTRRGNVAWTTVTGHLSAKIFIRTRELAALVVSLHRSRLGYIHVAPPFAFLPSQTMLCSTKPPGVR